MNAGQDGNAIAQKERELSDRKELARKLYEEVERYRKTFGQLNSLARGLADREKALKKLRMEILGAELNLKEECWQIEILFERILEALSDRGEWCDRKRIEISQLEVVLLRDRRQVEGIKILEALIENQETNLVFNQDLSASLQKEVLKLRKEANAQSENQAAAVALVNGEAGLKAQREQVQKLEAELQSQYAFLRNSKSLQNALSTRGEEIRKLRSEIEQVEAALKTESSQPGFLAEKQKKLVEAFKVREEQLNHLKQQLKTFLEHVVWGREDEAQAMLKKNAELALGVGTVTDSAGRKFTNLTGFQYAVWALDWKMWEMIKPYLSSDAQREQAKGFKEGEWVKEHNEHAEWQKLLDAQKTFVDNASKWGSNKTEKHWVEQVGGAQRSLPIHVLQEYCNPERPFDPCPKFDEQYRLKRALPDWLDARLKGVGGVSTMGGRGGVAGDNDGTLVRAGRCSWVCALYESKSPDAVEGCVADRGALVSLLATRVQQREKLVSDLVSVKKRIPPQEVATFLKHVVWGREDEAQAMLKKNAELALGIGTVTDSAGRKFTNLTGFQYAVWALDWKMWEMIKPYLSSDAQREQAKGFKEGEWVKEHNEHAEWQKLLDAQKAYVDNYSKWDANQCSKHWVEQVGGAQRCLPIHVLQEYNNPNRPFDPCPKFDEQYKLERALPNWMDAPLKGVGNKFDFAVWRAGCGELVVCVHEAGGYTDEIHVGPAAVWARAIVTDDRSALASLFSTRVQQREKLVSDLVSVKNPGFARK